MGGSSSRRRVVVALAATAAVLAQAPSTGAAPSTTLLVAEVYGGGGNSGATLTHDFVELANAGDAATSIEGWSVQYLPASPGAATVWQVTPLGGSVPAGSRYLVAESQGAGGTQPLPTPDATGTIPMSATGGTIALVNTTTALTCKTAADCAADSRIVDLVGYGSAVVRETSPTAATSNTTSAARPALVDTDDNSIDFAVGSPTPSGTGDPPEPEVPVLDIHEIQGAAHRSPFDGQLVETDGIVTAVRPFGSARGFWIQDPGPDADPATSEGVFVFTGSVTPTVAVGDLARVRATVDEFHADAAPASSVLLPTTELVGATVQTLSTGNPLPAAELLGPGTVPSTYTRSPGGAIDALTLDPAGFALDFFESREGMRVEVRDVRVVGPTTAFNELFVTTEPDEHPTPRGGTIYGGYDQQNSGRLLVQSLIPFADRPFPQVDVGDHLAGSTIGPVDHSRFGGFMLQATALGLETAGGIQPEVAAAGRPNELSVATYNVENLDAADPQEKFDRLATGVVANLRSPDIVALEEVQDDNGPTNDGTVSAGQTLDRLVAAIVGAGGPHYAWRQIDPVDGADGGEPGGNIRVAFLFDPSRVQFVDRPGGDATTAVAVEVAGRRRPALSVSPGRIDPASTAWTASRKPLVGEFTFNGRTVFVVAAHFTSKSGDQPLFGRYQPPTRSSEVQRIQQAAEVREFVDAVRAVDPGANVVVAGDLNDFEFSPTLQQLTAGGGLVDLITTLPAPERYTYVFQDNSQTLDHILVGGRLKAVAYDVVHINAEFADQASDHDPQIVRFRPG